MKVREIMNIIVVRCTWLHIGYSVDKRHLRLGFSVQKSYEGISV